MMLLVGPGPFRRIAFKSTNRISGHFRWPQDDLSSAGRKVKLLRQVRLWMFAVLWCTIIVHSVTAVSRQHTQWRCDMAKSRRTFSAAETIVSAPNACEPYGSWDDPTSWCTPKDTRTGILQNLQRLWLACQLETSARYSTLPFELRCYHHKQEEVFCGFPSSRVF